MLLAHRMLVACGLMLAGGSAAGAPATIVVCAPGYPSDTEQAQPTMDALAGAVAAVAGWPAARLTAVYDPTLDGGLARIDGDAALAIVPLPLYLSHGRAIGLRPLLEAVPASGESEVWSLVGRRGAIRGPDALAGVEIAGLPGYAPGFVRGVVLADWPELPADLEISFSGRPLGLLRRAAAGEPVAALLDAAQTASLGSLPFGAELEVVLRSSAVPSSLLCGVGDRLGKADAAALADAFARLGETDAGREVLATMRLARFAPTSTERLAELERIARR